MKGLGFLCRHKMIPSIEAAWLLAVRNMLPRSANQSSSFKMRPRNVYTKQIACLLQPRPCFLIDQKDMSTTAHQEHFAGLKWVPNVVHSVTFYVPKWTIEPDLEKIKEVTSEALSSKEISVTFFAQGVENKVYNVRRGEDDFIIRVLLPVEPWWKTLSEVGTVKWAQCNTHLQVPHILAYDPSRDNSIGFEWILMSKLPRKPLAEVWDTMQFSAKKKLVQELAIYSAAMFRKQLHGIGNIYVDSKAKGKDGENVDGDNLPEVKRIFSRHFYWPINWGQCPLHSISRGPFCCSKDWIAARLSCFERNCHFILSRLPKKEKADMDDEESEAFEAATRTLEIIGRLKPVLHDIFPSGDPEPEPSMLFHENLTRDNILVDDAGALTGVVDWENVSALPLWKACYYPHFLDEERPRVTKPIEEDYYESEDDPPKEVYYEDLLEYELTILCDYFLDEMRRLEPDWMQVFEATQQKRDFDLAVELCDSLVYAEDVNIWIDGITSGIANFHSLHDVINAREE